MTASTPTPTPTWWRCTRCPTTGAGEDGATRHERSRRHRTETTTRRDVFARWQKEMDER